MVICLFFPNRLPKFPDFIPQGTLRSRTQWGSFDSLSILSCLRNGFGTFKILILHRPFWNLENALSPEVTAIAEPNLVHLTVFPFYCVWGPVLTLSKSSFSIGLFEILKMFYPPKGLCEAEPNGVHLTVFPFYCVWETVLTLSKSQFSIGLFEILKMFYPPKGLCKADTEGGPIVFTYVLFCLWKGILDFQNSRFQAAFLKSWKCFIPRRDSAQ